MGQHARNRWAVGRLLVGLVSALAGLPVWAAAPAVSAAVADVERPPPVGASGRPILTLYGQDTREVYRCSGAQRGAGALFTDVDCPPGLSQRVAVRLWLSRVGEPLTGPVRPARIQEALQRDTGSRRAQAP